MPAKFTLTKTAGGKFHFSLLASNGSVIASSQPYATKASALNGLESFRKTAQSAALSDFTTSSRVPAAKPAQDAPGRQGDDHQEHRGSHPPTSSAAAKPAAKRTTATADRQARRPPRPPRPPATKAHERRPSAGTRQAHDGRQGRPPPSARRPSARSRQADAPGQAHHGVATTTARHPVRPSDTRGSTAAKRTTARRAAAKRTTREAPSSRGARRPTRKRPPSARTTRASDREARHDDRASGRRRRAGRQAHDRREAARPSSRTARPRAPRADPSARPLTPRPRPRKRTTAKRTTTARPAAKRATTSRPAAKRTTAARPRGASAPPRCARPRSRCHDVGDPAVRFPRPARRPAARRGRPRAAWRRSARRGARSGGAGDPTPWVTGAAGRAEVRVGGADRRGPGGLMPDRRRPGRARVRRARPRRARRALVAAPGRRARSAAAVPGAERGPCLLVALGVATACPAVRAARLNARLSMAASVLRRRPMDVHCQTFTEASLDADGAPTGTSRTGRTASPAAAPSSTATQCGAHPRLARPGGLAAERGGGHRGAHPVARGDARRRRDGGGDRRVPRRPAGRRARRPARRVTRGRAELARRYYREMYPRLGDTYRTADCAPGGRLDEQRPAPPW